MSRYIVSAGKSSPRILLLLEEGLRRDIDVIGSLLFLIVSLPIFATLALLIAADGGPVFFSHRRVGMNGVTFGCWKFRTMVVGAEECLSQYLRYHPEAKVEWDRSQKLAVDPRITPLGQFLRKTTLDEMPQMWNVLRGDMSLVGPRPVTVAEMSDRYGAYADVVTSIRPGVTGPWQVTPDRNEIDYNQRVQLDVSYVRERNIIRDIRTLYQTALVVFGRSKSR